MPRKELRGEKCRGVIAKVGRYVCHTYAVMPVGPSPPEWLGHRRKLVRGVGPGALELCGRGVAGCEKGERDLRPLPARDCFGDPGTQRREVLSPVAAAGPGVEEIPERVRPLRRGGRERRKAARRLIEAREVVIGVAEVLERPLVTRLQAQRLLERADGLRLALEAEERRAAIVVRRGKIGRERNHPLEARERLRIAAQLHEGAAEVVPGEDEARIRSHRDIEIRERLGVAPERKERVAARQVNHRGGGPAGCETAETFERLRSALAPEQQAAAIEERRRALRVERQGTLVLVQSLLQPAAKGMRMGRLTKGDDFVLDLGEAQAAVSQTLNGWTRKLAGGLPSRCVRHICR